MNLKAILFSLFSFLVISGVQAQFEGTIIMNSSVAADIDAVFSVKGNQVLMEADSERGKMQMISEKESGNIIVLTESDGKKVAIKMNPTAMQNAGVPGLQQQTTTNDTKINVTTERKTIDGYNCVKVTGEDKDATYEAWVTKDLNFSIFDLFPVLKDASSYSAETDIMETIFKEGFILEMTEKKKKTGKLSTMTAKVKEEKIDASIFNISEEDYQVFDLTDMAKLMQEASANPEKMQELQKVFEELSKNY